MSKQYDTYWDYMVVSLTKKIEEMDVSDVKDGEIINVNELEIDRAGDFGIDNKKEIYTFTGKNWRHI